MLYHVLIIVGELLPIFIHHNNNNNNNNKWQDGGRGDGDRWPAEMYNVNLK